MGQYWYPVNLTKKECIDPHKLGSGLKLWEQIANAPGVGAALVILCAAQRERRGGGDLDIEENWHGPERTDMSGAGEMPASYEMVAARTIGRWAGDQIAIVGDYAEDGDLAPEHQASTIYHRCQNKWDEKTQAEIPNTAEFRDITDLVCRVIEHELQGTFVGDGWRHFERKGESK